MVLGWYRSEYSQGMGGYCDRNKNYASLGSIMRKKSSLPTLGYRLPEGRH